MFWLFGCKACGILAPRPGMEPASPTPEGEVLTPGPPGKFPQCFFFFFDSQNLDTLFMFNSRSLEE